MSTCIQLGTTVWNKVMKGKDVVCATYNLGFDVVGSWQSFGVKM
jgi:hypothetical protein